MNFNIVVWLTKEIVANEFDVFGGSWPLSLQVLGVNVFLHLLKNDTFLIEGGSSIKSANLLLWPRTGCIGTIHGGSRWQSLGWIDVVTIVNRGEGCHDLNEI